MAEKPAIKIGYLKITDHFILGVTARKLQQRMETFQHCTLEPVVKNGWNEVADALSVKSLDGALVLAPTAMDLFKSGVDLKLLLNRRVKRADTRPAPVMSPDTAIQIASIPRFAQEWRN